MSVSFPNRSAAKSFAVRHASGLALISAAAALGALAYYNIRRARAAEARDPPIGKWIEVEGVRLHYFEKGEGPALTLIHGNLATGEDFAVSGLVDRLAESFRVIVVDRPGFGFSARPGRFWTPSDYAGLLRKALEKIGVRKAIVVGHSYGAMVAMALALEHPAFVTRLTLIGGYFYPSPRIDVALLAQPAIPVLGDILRFTLSPLIMRSVKPALDRILFAPAPVAQAFALGFPHGLSARPLQIRAQAEDALTMVPAAARMQERYRQLDMPVAICAGADDHWVDARTQSGRLHEEIPGSRLDLYPGVGHMAHYSALRALVAALEELQGGERQSLSAADGVGLPRRVPVGGGAAPPGG